MMNVIKRTSFIFLTLICFATGFAQNNEFDWKNNFLWDSAFFGFFDNRESKAPFQIPLTIFGARITTAVGIHVLENNL